MKKAIALALALLMLISCSAALAENLYDKDIQFSGHAFGETFARTVEGISLTVIEFQMGDTAAHSRNLVDPMYGDLTWLTEQNRSDTHFCFLLRPREQKVAGYDATVKMYFYYPDADAAAKNDIGNAKFYAGCYEFYNEDANEVFEGLQGKLTSLYGEPYAETDNANDIWGELNWRKGPSQVEINTFYRSALEGVSPLKYVTWKSSTNNGMVVLVNYVSGGTPYTFLYYLDINADEAILALYDDGTSDSDSVEGL